MTSKNSGSNQPPTCGPVEWILVPQEPTMEDLRDIYEIGEAYLRQLRKTLRPNNNPKRPS
jgi:hypothetical protein